MHCLRFNTNDNWATYTTTYGSPIQVLVYNASHEMQLC